MAGSQANAEWGTWFQDVIEEIVDADGGLITASQVWHMDEDLAVRALEEAVTIPSQHPW